MSDDKKYRRVKKFRLDEVSLVDRPAHGPARIAIMKRADDTPTVDPIQKKLAMTSLTAGHAHSVIMVQGNSDQLVELRAGQTSFVDGHAHDWVMDDAGNIIFADAEGHSHGLSVLITKADDGINDDILAEGILASLAPATEQASEPTAGDSGDSTGDDIMSKKETTTDGDPAAVNQEQLDELTKSNKRLEQIVKLSPEQRAHFDKLEGDEQDNFLSTEDKDAVLKNLADEDPIVYTANDGTEIRKSAGDHVLRLTKDNDELRKTNQENAKLAKRAAFEKQAKEELEHLSGDDNVKADLLEGVDSLPVEKREAVMAILKSKDAGMAKAFEKVSTSGEGDGSDAEAKLDALAKAHQEKNKDITPEQAYSAVLDTPEGQELHAQLNG
jgi:hypothetical protein